MCENYRGEPLIILGRARLSKSVNGWFQIFRVGRKIATRTSAINANSEPELGLKYEAVQREH